MENLDFSYNWNNKLGCNYFTTLRIFNPDKYKIGNQFDITLKKSSLFIAEIVDIKTLYINQLNHYICGIDTGYSVEETKKILIRMYTEETLQKKPLALILLKKIK